MKLLLNSTHVDMSQIVQSKFPRATFPDTVLHISASNDHLLTIADLMQIKKMDNEGHIRPYW